MKTAIFEKTNWKDWNITIPLIQGGMGVGVSLSGLAGAVAREGGMGVISTAQIGYDAPDFVGNESECNLQAIRRHIERARKIARGKGMIAVNVMVALQHYKEHVLAAVQAGVDAIICGAGLPMDLPALVKGSSVKIAPIVSSRKAAALILKAWMKKDHVLPDFIVVEGPKAGGHLGFHEEDIERMEAGDFDEEIAKAFEIGREYDEKEVNEIIETYFDDYCTIRRDMISEGIMKREGVTYTRKK